MSKANIVLEKFAKRKNKKRGISPTAGAAIGGTAGLALGSGILANQINKFLEWGDIAHTGNPGIVNNTVRDRSLIKILELLNIDTHVGSPAFKETARGELLGKGGPLLLAALVGLGAYGGYKLAKDN